MINTVYWCIDLRVLLLSLIYTQIVLNEKNVKINELKDNIDLKITKEKILTKEVILKIYEK